jgi:hypothetical protein
MKPGITPRQRRWRIGGPKLRQTRQAPLGPNRTESLALSLARNMVTITGPIIARTTD